MSEEFDNFKEQVRSSADIVDVVSGYVTLKKRGNNYWGCCPFHGEKTPSFAVNPQKNFFYCFGCHTGGDVFRFVMKIENCNFMEAIKILAGKYGIPVPERQKSAREIEREKLAKEITDTNAMAARFFSACLNKTDYGKPALAYLIRRGITPAIIESFSIGYALDNFNALVTSLGRRGYSAELLIKAGLASAGRSGGAYDKFRGRVMIPIKDPRGRIVGFGGRVLGDGQPKYLNTAETEWFNKRHLLFGMDIALQQIKKSGIAIVVEGYMDAISLHAAGIGNVVASMGTAFAAEQARILKRMADEVIFCYDSDSAGRRASVRAVSIARSTGLKVRIAGVPDGKDPDEYVRHYGREAFEKVLAEAVEGIEFQISETISQNNVTNLAGKVEAVANILPFLLECKTEIEAAEHIRRLAQRLTIDEGLILEEYRKAARKGAQREERQEPRQINLADNSAENAAEELLLAVLLEHPDLAMDCRPIIEEVGFTSSERQQIYDALVQNVHGDAVDINSLSEVLSDAASSALAGIMARHVPEGAADRIADDCLRQMRRAYLEKEYDRHSQMAAEYEKSGDNRFMNELVESQRIKNEIKKLYGK